MVAVMRATLFLRALTVQCLFADQLIYGLLIM